MKYGALGIELDDSQFSVLFKFEFKFKFKLAFHVSLFQSMLVYARYMIPLSPVDSSHR